ncbi:urea carboxylase-associated family protein [Halieaceae bacterium IMCC14734]|uniref:Urea carboxylase-associated family protein n=1 Tax=Candidatus Litorirhabdus singularis TaxID=2518993 RepID=A0ABT3TEI8_9GAMM|nr:urea amidolyase associated protein UAAP1 [Candidatus Litorirhabdus singularis]MCX2980664.1 urea carboxylase-associated family protein [Candidatus Litorirhabdus singularis]
MGDSSHLKVFYQDTLPGGSHWSMTLRKGTTLRLIDDEGGANVGMLMYNPSNPLERYNAPDTLKCQHSFKLTRGHCLYSDMGRIFCSIIEDTAGWHDTVCGNSNRAMIEEKWGHRSYQEYRNDWQLNGHDSLLVEVAKYGLGKKDLAANLNLFSKVAVDESGNLQFDESHGTAGSFVDLRFEMDTLVVMHTCPHPLNPAEDYPRKSVSYHLRKSNPVAVDDLCRNHCPENQRGFQNTELFTLGLPGASS